MVVRLSLGRAAGAWPLAGAIGVLANKDTAGDRRTPIDGFRLGDDDGCRGSS